MLVMRTIGESAHLHGSVEESRQLFSSPKPEPDPTQGVGVSPRPLTWALPLNNGAGTNLKVGAPV